MAALSRSLGNTREWGRERKVASGGCIFQAAPIGGRWSKPPPPRKMPQDAAGLTGAWGRHAPAPVSPAGVSYLALLPAPRRKALEQREADVCSLREKGRSGQGWPEGTLQPGLQGTRGGREGALPRLGSHNAQVLERWASLLLGSLQDESGPSPRCAASGEKSCLSPKTFAALARNNELLIFEVKLVSSLSHLGPAFLSSMGHV